MKILKLAVLELVRRPKKNMVIAAAIIIAVALLTSLSIVSSSANQAIMEIIAKTGHTLTVRPAGGSGGQEKSQEYRLTTSEVVLNSYIPEQAVPEIMKNYDKAIKAGWEKKGGLVANAGIPDVVLEPATWAPRLFEKTEVNGQEVVVTGVELRKEYFVRFWWNLTSGEWPADTDIRDVNTNVSSVYTIGSDGKVVTRKAEYGVDTSGRLVAAGTERDMEKKGGAPAGRPLLKGWDDAYLGGAYARAGRLKLGDKLTIKNNTFIVRGILEETNSADDYMIYIPLATAQRLFHKEGLISMVSVRAMCPNCPVGDAMVELNKTVTGITAVSQLDVAGVQFDFFNMLYKFLLAVVVSTIAVGIFSIFNIVTGSLYGRVREIGMLKAIGASRSQLFRIFIYEHFILGLASGVTGYLLGLGMAYVLNSLLDIGAVIRISTDFLPRALVLGVVCSLAAVIYPAYKLSMLKITETFRTQWES